MADTSYLEVRCERCQTSFAPGTKQCVHCGAALGRRLLALDALAPKRAGVPTPDSLQTPDADAQPKAGRILQFAMFAVAVIAVIVRSCASDS